MAARRTLNDVSYPDTAKVEALFASIGEGVITTDEKGLITRINEVALRMLGFKKSEVLQQRFPDKIVAVYDNGSPINVLDRPISKAFLTGQTVHAKTTYRRQDGSLLPAQLTVSPIIFHDKPIGAIEVFRDLTDEIESDKMKSDFISIASHQLRTPLSAINMYTRMLKDGYGGEVNQEQLAFIGIILSSVERMNDLIDTLLNITRIEAGGIIPKPHTVQLASLLEAMVMEIIPDCDEKSLSLTTTIASDLPTVETDDLLVKEIYANLLSNAVKYTPAGGKIKIKLYSTSKDIICSIQDTGYGIPLKSQKHIFTKFFRAENVTRQDVSGTGLGLYLIKAIAEKLGGELWFESVEGKGTTFSFSLPRR